MRGETVSSIARLRWFSIHCWTNNVNNLSVFFCKRKKVKVCSQTIIENLNKSFIFFHRKINAQNFIFQNFATKVTNSSTSQRINLTLAHTERRKATVKTTISKGNWITYMKWHFITQQWFFTEINCFSYARILVRVPFIFVLNFPL